MPTVPKYGQPKVGAAPIPGARKREGETAESLGIGIARAEGVVGDTMAGVGDTIARVGVQAIGEIHQLEADRADQIAALTFNRQLGELQLELENNVAQTRGKDTLPLRQTVLEAFDKQTGTFAERLTSQRQRIAFEQAKGARRLAITDSVNTHTMREMDKYEGTETTAALETSSKVAIANYNDPRRIAEEFGRMASIVATHGARIGMGPEAQAALLKTMRSETHIGVIEQMLEHGQDRTAAIYVEEVKDQIDGDKQAKIEHAVRIASTDAAGERTAAAIWDKFAPPTDDDPISLDKMEAAARAQLGDDTNTLKATIASLRSRKQGVDDGRRERLDARGKAIWGSVLKGASYDSIRRLPEAIAAPEELLKVRDYLQRQDEHRESLAASRESRAAARDQREYTADLRKEKQLEINGWAEYWQASQPEALRNSTPGAIMAGLPTRGQAHTERLLNDLDRYTKDQSSLGKVSIDADLFKDVARPALSYVDKPATPTQKANVGKLQALVEDEIARKQQSVNRTLTRDEQRATAQAIVDTKVMVDGFWYDDAQVAAIVNEKDRATAYVPMADIPAGAMREALNYVRGLSRETQSMPDMELRARYADRLQRAYARTLMRGTRVEVEAILKGAQ
jgi:hypothetical protein